MSLVLNNRALGFKMGLEDINHVTIFPKNKKTDKYFKAF